jgi:hypothetical protein
VSDISSISTGEGMCERCNRGESEDSHDAQHLEGSNATSRAEGTESERQPAVSPSSSQEEYRAQEAFLHAQNFTLYQLLRLGDEGPVC